LAKAFPDC
jgi:hypothetical protein